MIPFKQVKNIAACLDKLGSLTGEAHSLVSASLMFTLDHPSYIPKHFKIEELFPPEAIKLFGSNCYQYMDSRILWTIDSLREWLDLPIYINIPSSGLFQRGFRLEPVKAKYSPHLFGRAVDFNIEGFSDEKTQNLIKDNFGKVTALRFITRIEDGTKGWTHIDCVNTGKDTLTIFKG